MLHVLFSISNYHIELTQIQWSHIYTWRAPIAALWNLKSVLKSCAISRTNLWNGSLRMRSSVDFWYLLISRRATVPGLYLWGFFTPPVDGALFLAAFVANCFRGALPPVDLRAVCLVLAISVKQEKHVSIFALIYQSTCFFYGFKWISNINLYPSFFFIHFHKQKILNVDNTKAIMPSLEYNK